MGVHGLWKLIEPSGKPVPLETLEDKVLAVDISIWLHQAIKGFQDAKGGVIPNAHLLGIYHRVCKLLYFKIKPVFVFDGGVPALKRQTIAKRNQLKSKNSSEAERLQKQLLNTLLKHSAISKVLSEKTKASIAAQTKNIAKDKDEIFRLPLPSEMDSTISSSEEEEFEYDSTDSTDPSPVKHYDLHTIDTKSPYFQSLPLETRHEILTELKETRKQSSWGRLHELPKKSDDFSSYQMNRLLKRQQVQAALDDATQKMGGASLSLTELESLLHDHGIPTSDNVGQRIASDSTTRFLYIKDIKEALEKAKIAEKEKKQDVIENPNEEIKLKTKADLEEEEELQRAIALSLQNEPSCSINADSKMQDFSFLENFKDEDFESDTSEEDIEQNLLKEKFSSAQSYMMEYSGLTPNEISKIISENLKKGSKKVKFGNIAKTRDKVNTQKISSSGTITLEKNAQHDEIICDSTTVASENSIETKGKHLERQSGKNKCAQTKKAIWINNDTNKVGNSKISIVDNVIEENVENLFNTAVKEDVVENSLILVKDNKIEVLSDSESCNSDDLVLVEESEKADFKSFRRRLETSEPIQLVIHSEKKTEDHDLFSDIFEDMRDVEKLEEILSQRIGVIEEKLGTNDNCQQIPTFSGKVFNLSNKEITEKHSSNIENTMNIVQGIVEDNKTVLINSIKENEVKSDQLFNSQKEYPAKITPVLSVANNEEMSNKNIVLPKEQKELIREVPTLTISQLQGMKNDLQQEKNDLLIEKGTKERLATNISDQMYQEAQELLQLFGVPYVIAPMEAEAQCAFLDEIELTDGTITDDSDIWLFGGRTVYKNFFDQAKYVMEFKAENIKHHFKLSRQQMILLALLVGSDYTIGVRGIGPVTAMEILSSFPPPQANEFDVTQAQLISGLKEFKTWFYKGKSSGPGRSVLKNKLNNITFSENFPNIQVVQAYMEPTVETSRETFSWAKPDFVALGLFAREKLGWSSKKTEEILNPVMKSVEKSRIQKSIKEYFKTKFKLDGGSVGEKMSKRVKLAIERFGKTEEQLIAEEMELLEKAKKLKRTAQFVEGEPKKKYNKKTKIQSSSAKVDNISNKMTYTETKVKKEQPSKKSLTRSDWDNELETITNQKESTECTTSTSEGRANKSEKARKKADSEKSSSDQKSSDIGKKQTSLIKEVESASGKMSAEELKLYENVAIELRQRRQRRNELAKIKLKDPQRQRTKNLKKPVQNELVQSPTDLEDEEIQNLMMVTTMSDHKIHEIHNDVKKKLNEDNQKGKLPVFHKKEVIHQKLKDQSDVLRNKLKAIEVFRKSKKGPGYVSKRCRKKGATKEETGLSEDSDQ